MATKKVNKTTEDNDLFSGEALELNAVGSGLENIGGSGNKTPQKHAREAPKSPHTATKISLGIYPLNPSYKMPTKGSEEASCFDLYANFTKGDVYKQYDDNNLEIQHQTNGEILEIHPHCRVMIPTGIRMDIPKGYGVKLYVRSGISVKAGLTLINSVGIIDSDYRNEVYLVVYNTTNKRYYVENGDRVGQFEVHKVEDFDIVELKEYDETSTKRGLGGFGSTGV